MRLFSSVTAAFLLSFLGGCLDDAEPKGEVPPPVEMPEQPTLDKLYIVATDVSTPFAEGVFKLRAVGSTSFAKDSLINLTFKNAVGNQYVHNLVLEGYEIKIEGVKDMPVSVLFNATKSGTFSFYCDKTTGVGPSPAFMNHRELGMEGSITIR